MKEIVVKAIVGAIFLAIASYLLAPRFSTGEIIGLYFLVVAAVI